VITLEPASELGILKLAEKLPPRPELKLVTLIPGFEAVLSPPIYTSKTVFGGK
jgi:hypothetical protein